MNLCMTIFFKTKIISVQDVFILQATIVLEGKIKLFLVFCWGFILFFLFFFSPNSFPLKNVIIMLQGETKLLVGFFHKNSFSITNVINSL